MADICVEHEGIEALCLLLSVDPLDQILRGLHRVGFEAQLSRKSLHELTSLGHRRIVVISRKDRVVPEPALDERNFIAGQQHPSEKGVNTPQDVSLIGVDPDPSFAWFGSPVTHMRWDLKKGVNRVVRWARSVSVGNDNRKGAAVGI